MLRKFVIIGALGAFAAPAYAGEVYGPIEPLAAPTAAETPPSTTMPDRFTVKPDETPEQAMRRYRRTFNTWRYVGWGLAAADIATTQSCLSRKTCQEGNPIYGKNPSLWKMVAIRVPMEIAIDYLAWRAFRKDPEAAIRAVQIKAGITGVVVGLNLRF